MRITNFINPNQKMTFVFIKLLDILLCDIRSYLCKKYSYSRKKGTILESNYVRYPINNVSDALYNPNMIFKSH